MKKILIIAILAMVLVMPAVLAIDTGAGMNVSIITQKFAPKVWLCGDRTTMDDPLENGANNLSLSERKHNYAFEGESIHWTVLVMDKNKIEEVTDVVGTVGSVQGTGNDVEVECKRTLNRVENPYTTCKATVGEDHITVFNPDVMAVYDCRLTVETPASMHGEYFLTVEAKDNSGESGTMAENEYWFLNPAIALSVDGTISFSEVMPGTESYSSTVLVGNDAESGSGVILDMFISGTDFYDPSSSGARCSGNTNKLALGAFSYFATNGAYSSLGQPADTDANGYTTIPYSNEISGAKRMIRWNSDTRGLCSKFKCCCR